jgi:hypothetical protein
MVATAASAPPQSPKPVRRKNELSLSGIRPGKDTISAVKKRLLWMFFDQVEQAPHEWVLHDMCGGVELRIEIGEREMVQSVDAGPGAAMADCRAHANMSIRTTGRGLRLHDKLERAIEIYGEPNSRGPSVRNGVELELLYYAFDWAGSDVPQVMEVSCDKASGRVVEIMLAFPGL